MAAKQARDARKKLEGEKNIKHRRITDESGCVSSVHSNVSRVRRVRMPVKPNKAPQTQPQQTTSTTAWQSQLIQFTPTTAEQINKEQPQRPKRNTTTKTNQAPSTKRKRTSPYITESDKSLHSAQTPRQIFIQ